MARNILRTGKQARQKTAVKGKRYRCAKCRKRSPKPVKTPAPWYCPNCPKEGRLGPVMTPGLTAAQGRLPRTPGIAPWRARGEPAR
jgi:ribosomal protein L37AE/L43A